MKKTYETPNDEKISFEYQEQVVASNAATEGCISVWINTGVEGCSEDKFMEKIQN